jgi:hypothetical protein
LIDYTLFKFYKERKMKLKAFILLILVALMSAPAAMASDPDPTVLTNKAAIDLVQTHANYLWTLVAACLVFFMQAGFAMVEAGFTRAKNAINIMMKNLMDFSIGSIAFWAIGFGLMFGATSTGWFGTTGFFLSDFTPDGDPWVLAFWMFQVVFAATAATIVSGAMAERTKFTGYILYSIVVSGLIYPVFGSWAWGSLLNGSGWLEGFGFIDFAGSTVVHSVGGWAALAGAIVLGPRLGKYTKDGKIKPIMGHNIPLAALGRVHPVAGMVRVQPRIHHHGGHQHRHDLRQHQPGRRGRCRSGHDHLLDEIRQARSGHEPQRRPGRPGGHHGRLCQCVANQRDHHRCHCRYHRRLLGHVL